MRQDHRGNDWQLVIHTKHAVCYVSDAHCLLYDADQQHICHKLAELYYQSLTQPPKEDNNK